MYNISIPIIRTMSQSDYIKRKQIAHTLRNDGFNVPNRLPAVFSSNTLLKYKQYQIVNDDSNTKINYNLLTPVNNKIIFDMERNVAGCPTFVVCKDTQTRPNRVLRSEKECDVQIYPLTWEDRKNVPIKSQLCRCQLKRKHINKNVCSCDAKSV
jgi:hypothetical protein